MLILRTAPQDLPYSPVLTGQLAVGYFLSGLVVLQTTLNPADLYAGLILGLIIQYVFTWLVLGALKLRTRFVQTFAAMMGVGLLFNLMSWPVFSTLSDASNSDSMKATMSLTFLMLLSWEVLIKAHIFRHAMQMKMFSALALSFSLFFISVAFSQLVFPVEATG